jgi:hypothetical protein
MIPDFSGDFVNFNSTSDGDILEIIDEGKVEFNETLKKKMFNLHVKKGDKTMTWSPSNKHGKLLQQTFGMDSAGWIGKKVQVVHIEDTMLIKPLLI